MCWWANWPEILGDTRPDRKIAAMFLDMAFGSPIYERLRALGHNNVFEVNFGLTHTPDRFKANMGASDDPIASALLYAEPYESSGYAQIFRSTSPMGSPLR